MAPGVLVEHPNDVDSALPKQADLPQKQQEETAQAHEPEKDVAQPSEIVKADSPLQSEIIEEPQILKEPEAIQEPKVLIEPEAPKPTEKVETSADEITETDKSLVEPESSKTIEATETKENVPRVQYTPGRVPKGTYTNYQFEDLKPTWPDVDWEPLKEVPYEDKGLLGDPEFKNLLSFPGIEIFDHLPRIGTEIRGVKLEQLNDAQKNDVARLVATRGVVFFRDQKDLDIDSQKKFSSYFGTLHKHATTGIPSRPGLDDVHIVYTPEDGIDRRSTFTPNFHWHSDITYELQPPSYTVLKLIETPEWGGGGDTFWASLYAAYDALSPSMQKYLESLTALHSAEYQAEMAEKAGTKVRRKPIVTVHPLIRTHPVTGWKSVFYNPGFVTKIVGVPKLESDYILNFLLELITTTCESRVSFRWKTNDVAIWDNRVLDHSATYGFEGYRRHAVRTCCQGEKPYFDPNGKSQETERRKREGLLALPKDCSGVLVYND